MTTPESDPLVAVRHLERRVEELERRQRLARADVGAEGYRRERWLAVVLQSGTAANKCYPVALKQLVFDTSNGLFPHSPAEIERTRGSQVLARLWGHRQLREGDQVVVERIPGRLAKDGYKGEWFVELPPLETRWAFLSGGWDSPFFGYTPDTPADWEYELLANGLGLDGNPLADGSPMGNAGYSLGQRLTLFERGYYLVRAQATISLELETSGGGYIDRSVDLTLGVAQGAGDYLLWSASQAQTKGLSRDHTVTLVGMELFEADDPITFNLVGQSYVPPAAGAIAVYDWYLELFKVPV